MSTKDEVVIWEQWWEDWQETESWFFCEWLGRSVFLSHYSKDSNYGPIQTISSYQKQITVNYFYWRKKQNSELYTFNKRYRFNGINKWTIHLFILFSMKICIIDILKSIRLMLNKVTKQRFMHTEALHKIRPATGDRNSITNPRVPGTGLRSFYKLTLSSLTNSPFGDSSVTLLLHTSKWHTKTLALLQNDRINEWTWM